MEFLITGTGRCGTGYVANVLTSAGVNCTHEGVFNLRGWEAAWHDLELRHKNEWWGWRGESSWLAAPFLDRPELDDLTVVHLVRHPGRVINSHLRLMAYCQYGPYYKWMTQFIPGIEQYEKPEERAAYWYVRLNEMVEARADVFHRVEDDVRELLKNLGIDYAGKELFANTRYNGRAGCGPAVFNPDVLPAVLQYRLLTMAEQYGYDLSDDPPNLIEAGWMSGVNVLIDARAALVGGGFQLRDSAGKPLAYDAQLIEFFLEQIRQVENPVIIDVGASTGSFTLLPLLHPGTTVHAFEPNPLAFQLLQSSVKANGLGDAIQLYQIALSNRNGGGALLVPLNAVHAAVACLSEGAPRPRSLVWREEPVEVCTLDSLPIERADFIKIDVEGAELLVLRGGEKLIRRCMPGLLVEFTALNTRQFDYEPGEITALLKAWGYTKFKRVGIEDLWAEQ